MQREREVENGRRKHARKHANREREKERKRDLMLDDLIRLPLPKTSSSRFSGKEYLEGQISEENCEYSVMEEGKGGVKEWKVRDKVRSKNSE